MFAIRSSRVSRIKYNQRCSGIRRRANSGASKEPDQLNRAMHDMSRNPYTALAGIALGLGVGYLYTKYPFSETDSTQTRSYTTDAKPVESAVVPTTSFRNFTKQELNQYNGVDSPQILIAVKGKVYDVSAKRAMYGPSGSYKVFAGKDASRALALGSTDEKEVANSDLSTLNEQQEKALAGWISFYEKNYPVVGKLDS